MSIRCDGDQAEILFDDEEGSGAPQHTSFQLAYSRIWVKFGGQFMQIMIITCRIGVIHLNTYLEISPYAPVKLAQRFALLLQMLPPSQTR